MTRKSRSVLTLFLLNKDGGVEANRAILPGPATFRLTTDSGFAPLGGRLVEDRAGSFLIET